MVGPGFVLLVLIWTVSILLCIVFTRWEGSAAYCGVFCILIALIITAVLWFHPRGKVPDDGAYVIYDETYILRTALVSVLAIMLFAGLLVVAVFYTFDQRRPAPIKPFTY